MGVSSSKTSTASTQPRASSTAARSAAGTSGRSGPLSRRTLLVAVEQHDQAVAERPGLLQHPDVAGVQQVEAAAGGDDRAAGGAGAGDDVVRGREVARHVGTCAGLGLATSRQGAGRTPHSFGPVGGREPHGRRTARGDEGAGRRRPRRSWPPTGSRPSASRPAAVEANRSPAPHGSDSGAGGAGVISGGRVRGPRPAGRRGSRGSRRRCWPTSAAARLAGPAGDGAEVVAGRQVGVAKCAASPAFGVTRRQPRDGLGAAGMRVPHDRHARRQRCEGGPDARLGGDAAAVVGDEHGPRRGQDVGGLVGQRPDVAAGAAAVEPQQGAAVAADADLLRRLARRARGRRRGCPRRSAGRAAVGRPRRGRGR